jgi:hypothetical protein
MTLSGPLCDDLAAVEACTYHPLPHLDASGRQLVFIDPKRHTREGYSSESMVRCVGGLYWFNVYAVVHLSVLVSIIMMRLTQLNFSYFRSALFGMFSR